MTDLPQTILEIDEVRQFFTPKVTADAPAVAARATAPKVRGSKTPPAVKVDDVKKRTRAEKYLEELAEEGTSLEEAQAIVEGIITKFVYTEVVPVTKTLSITLQTRPVVTNKRLNQVIGTEKPQSDASYLNILAQINLASSLLSYGSDTFDPSTEEGFMEAFDFVERLPQPIFVLLVEKLNRFDRKINLVMREGCIENF